MSINFIPNDPQAGSSAPAIRSQAARPNRPASASGFTLTDEPDEDLFQPGTPEFLFWQCREAAIAAVEAWEASAGAHKKWQSNRRALPLRQDAGLEFNAFYDRASFSFFHGSAGGKTFFSGASTDVVAHEVGHGLLDSVRPDFFDVNFLEVGAFHEAFGDCVAILTALEDKDTRTSLLDVTKTLRKRNFVETTAEDLSNGIRRLKADHNAAEPRHAFNTFQYQLPQTLPDDGGPGELINEVHSFGMLFTGCFWELLANVFNAASSQTPSSLLAAARTVGGIVVAGAKEATVMPRFFQSVGSAMVGADNALNGGANRDHIRGAFETHGITIAVGAQEAATMALAGPAPKGAKLSSATRRDLAGRLGIVGGRITTEKTSLFGAPVVETTHMRQVSLSAVDKSLKGVIALAPETMMVGSSGKRAALVGSLPHASDTESEVHAFVRSLLAHDRIDFGKPKKAGFVAAPSSIGRATHAIKAVAGKKILRRVSFQCGDDDLG